MRLDKFVAKAADVPRSKAKKLISSGKVSVDQSICKSANLLISDLQSIELLGNPLSYVQHKYILLNKPKGYICSTKDEQYPSALNLLDTISLEKLHFAGRLDVDTSGLVLISDNGQWTHRVTSPKHQHEKTYIVTTSEVVSSEQQQKLTTGIVLKDSAKATLPATVEIISEKVISLAITEGRYHQVKRMLAAVGNHVVDLHRKSIGCLTMDENMNGGDWRYLSQEEIDSY